MGEPDMNKESRLSKEDKVREGKEVEWKWKRGFKVIDIKGWC